MGRFARFMRKSSPTRFQRVEPELLLPEIPRQVTPDEANIPVLIIGAGLAGSMCAWQLSRIGFKHITITEATERIGGRCHSIFRFTSPHQALIEGGGELIGIGHRLWRALAQEFKLRLNLLPGHDGGLEANIEEEVIIINQVLNRISEDAKQLHHPHSP